MNRFVLLRHDVPPDFGRASHFDLMLEYDSELLTWAIDEIPLADRMLEAVQLPIHRLKYLDYEGAVSDNRGTVQRVDGGTFRFVKRTCNSIEILIDGKTLHGSILLARTSGEIWRLAYECEDC